MLEILSLIERCAWRYRDLQYPIRNRSSAWAWVQTWRTSVRWRNATASSLAALLALAASPFQATRAKQPILLTCHALTSSFLSFFCRIAAAAKDQPRSNRCLGPKHRITPQKSDVLGVGIGTRRHIQESRGNSRDSEQAFQWRRLVW